MTERSAVRLRAVLRFFATFLKKSLYRFAPAKSVQAYALRGRDAAKRAEQRVKAQFCTDSGFKQVQPETWKKPVFTMGSGVAATRLYAKQKTFGTAQTVAAQWIEPVCTDCTSFI